MGWVKQNATGSLLGLMLVVGGLDLTLWMVDAGYATVAAQTETQTQAPVQTPEQAKAQASEPSLPDGPGKDIVLRACVKCHALKITTSKRATEDGWAASVNTMVNRGAVLSDDEVDEVIEYLSKNFKPAGSDQKQPPDSAKPN